MTQMTVDLLKATLPKSMQGNATQELADHINNIALDPEVAEEVRNNFLSYTKVLQEGKFKTESYLDAVTYVTHKLMGYSNQDAYIRTFPQRYQALVAKGISAKDLSAYVSAYHSNKLVNLILEQSIVPSWLLNRDVYQRAINTQFELMTDVNVSAKVRSDAANSILTHLKQPEKQQVELQVGVKENGGIADLMATMQQLARQQRELIQNGVPARQMAQDVLVGRRVEEDKAEAVEVPFKVIEARVPAEQQAPQQATQQPAKVAQPPAQPGNPGVPPGPPPSPPPSLFQPSASRPAAGSETAAPTAPGATAASAASPPASAEGEGEDVGEGAGAQPSGHEAEKSPESPEPPRPSISLFDPGSFPIGA